MRHPMKLLYRTMTSFKIKTEKMQVIQYKMISHRLINRCLKSWTEIKTAQTRKRKADMDLITINLSSLPLDFPARQLPIHYIVHPGQNQL